MTPSAVPGHEDGPVAEQSVDEIVRALGFIVGKKAAAPDGSSVTFELTGPVRAHRPCRRRRSSRRRRPAAGTGHGHRGARVAAVHPAGVRPGRSGQALGEVQLSGDTDLGRRVVTSLPFTISNARPSASGCPAGRPMSRADSPPLEPGLDGRGRPGGQGPEEGAGPEGQGRHHHLGPVRRMALTTAAATAAGVTVPIPQGRLAPVAANMPGVPDEARR